MGIRPGLLQLINVTLPHKFCKLRWHAFSRDSAGGLMTATICNSCNSAKQLNMGQNKSCSWRYQRCLVWPKENQNEGVVASVPHQNPGLTVTTRHPVHNKPPNVQHRCMVVDMQNSDLMIIFPQNEKEGIHELNEFGEIVPPEDTYDLERRKQVLEALHIVGAFNPFSI